MQLLKSAKSSTIKQLFETEIKFFELNTNAIQRAALLYIVGLLTVLSSFKVIFSPRFYK